MLICDMVAFGVRAEAKIFEAAYGEPSGQKYWDAHLSEPIRVYTLAHVLSAHLAEQAEQVEMDTRRSMLLKATRFGDLRRSTLSWCRRTRISASSRALDRNSLGKL